MTLDNALDEEDVPQVKAFGPGAGEQLDFHSTQVCKGSIVETLREGHWHCLSPRRQLYTMITTIRERRGECQVARPGVPYFTFTKILR